MFTGGHWTLWVSAGRHETCWLTSRPLQDHPTNTPSLALLSFHSKHGGRPNIHFSTKSTCGFLSQGGMSPFKYSCHHLMLLQHYALGKSQWISFQATLWCPWEAVHAGPTACASKTTESHLMVTMKHCIPSSLSGAFSILKKWQVWHIWLPSLWTIKLLWI